MESDPPVTLLVSSEGGVNMPAHPPNVASATPDSSRVGGNATRDTPHNEGKSADLEAPKEKSDQAVGVAPDGRDDPMEPQGGDPGEKSEQDADGGDTTDDEKGRNIATAEQAMGRVERSFRKLRKAHLHNHVDYRTFNLGNAIQKLKPFLPEPK